MFRILAISALILGAFSLNNAQAQYQIDSDSTAERSSDETKAILLGEGTEEEEGVMHFWKDKMEYLILVNAV